MYFTLVRNRIKSEYFHYKQSIEAKNYETSFWQLSNNQSKNQFRIKISNKLPNISQRQPTSFSEYIKIQPLWIRELIQSYKHNTKEKSLFYRISRQIPLIISTDGAKGDRRIGGSLIIAKKIKHILHLDIIQTLDRFAKRNLIVLRFTRHCLYSSFYITTRNNSWLQ